MERFKSITIIFLLAFAVLASAEQTKPASVLLQEGLYAEQIEGDLDAAIKIYRQVIAESKEIQQTAAQAAYRIAMCYLKKGEKTEAARELRSLLSKFPQQQLLIKEAQKHLAKLEPLARFGPVIERLVNDDGVGQDFLLDLDTGRLYSASDAKEWSETSGAGQEKSLEDFIMESGVDLFGETSKKSLMGIDMIAMPTHNERWNMSPEDVIEQVSLGKPGTPVALSADGQLPKNFVFKTGQGGMGILQITEMQDGKAPRHFKIRYKMLQEAEKTARTEVLGPVIERVVHQPDSDKDCMIDFESGKLFKVPQQLKGLSQQNPRMVTWLEENGIDAVGAMNGALPGLEGILELVVQRMYGLGWNASPGRLVAEMAPRQCQHTAKIFAVGGLPFTYFFKTGQGGMGILQILEGQAGKAPRNVRIRYKMLQKAEKTARTEVLGPVIERVIYSQATGKPFFFDLDTGQAFYPPAGLTRHSPGREVIEWSATKGIDFVNDRGRFELVEMTAVKVVSGLWDSAGPAEIRDALMKGSNQEIIPTHSKDYTISSPITYVFKTRENGLGLLQILEKKDENIRIRYKILQQKPDLTAHKIFIPDADTKGVGVVLDLASGELLPAGQEQEQLTIFRKLGKGDLAYDGVLICLRGAKANLVVSDKRGDHLVGLETAGQIEDMTAYKLELRTIPGRLLVTTAEGDAYNVTLLAADARGIKLEYSKATGHDLMEQRSRSESASKLRRLGVAVVVYANEHNGQLPGTLQQVKDYVGHAEDFRWLLQNVEYAGKGKTLRGSPGELVAYDKTMLANGKGTNILYKDAHVQFLRPEELAREPGIEGLEKTLIHRRSDERNEPK
jgi:hypothetical protein